ncbi:MAG: hypothetical protein KDC56_12865 [Flavobacteriaceae bacterium]|nr:hypothetical protein [Flavobacteriaceae bacterium]
MIKKIAFFFLLGTSILLNAQQELTSFRIGMKKSNAFIEDVVPIINQSDGTISLFLIDSKNVYGYLLNDQFKLIDSLNLENKNKNYASIIGYCMSKDKDYSLLLTDNFTNKFAIVTFSYSGHQSTLNDLDLDFKNEVYIQSINHNNKIYLFTVTKKSSIINIYSIDNKGLTSKKTLNFNNKKFIDFKNKEVTLYQLLLPNNSILKGKPLIGSSKDRAQIVKINNDIINPIDITSSLSKFYVQNNTAFLTFDENKDFTQLISIDLSSFENNSLQIKKPFFDIEENHKKTNSFLLDNNIFMISSTKDAVTFVVKDIKDNAQIAQFTSLKKDTIDFKNSPIIQVGGYYDKYREFENTQKFLRKIFFGDVGISAYKSDNTYQVFIGGKVDYNAGGAGMVMGTSISSRPSWSGTESYNPTYFAYNLYAGTLSTYVKCLFDTSFNHLDGEIKPNIYDQIKEYKEIQKTTPNAKTIFKYKDFYILGSYFPWPHQVYRLRKFED